MAGRKSDPRAARINGVIGEALGGRIARIFEFIVIAEEELAAAGIKGSLEPLFPGEFVAYDRELYRHHARELVARMKAGANLDPGTRAEVMIVMMNASLKSPLTRAGQAVYEHLFVELFPGHAKKLEIVPCAPVHPKQVEEDIAEASWKLSGKRAKM